MTGIGYVILIFIISQVRRYVQPPRKPKNTKLLILFWIIPYWKTLNPKIKEKFRVKDSFLGDILFDARVVVVGEKGRATA